MAPRREGRKAPGCKREKGRRGREAGRVKGIRGRLRRFYQRQGRRIRKAALILAVLVLGLPLLLTLTYSLVPPPGTPLMILRLFEGEGLTKRWRSLEEISPNLRFAVIAGEDNHFCSHGGFDFASLREAWAERQSGGRSRGASTLSQQLAKNLFLWPGGGFLRKGVEAYFTLYLETLLSKQRILELYLNVAEWGPGVYGAQAGAQAHFGKAAADLSSREGALMAAVLPNPRRWEAGRPSDYISRRAGTLQTRVQQLGPLLDCAR